MNLTRTSLILCLLLGFTHALLSQQPPSPRLGHTMTKVGDKIIMFGGNNYENNISNLNNELWNYDELSDSWTLLSPTGTAPDPVSGHAAVAYNDTLYIVGGQTDAGVGSGLKMTVYKYSVSDNAWIDVSVNGLDIPLLTTDLVAQVIGDYIYTNGGTGVSGTSNETWRFDLKSNSWEQLAPCPYSEFGHCSAVFNEKFYLLRGLEMGHLVAAYDPETNTWETITPEISGSDSTNKPMGVYKAAYWFDESGAFSIGGSDITGDGAGNRLSKKMRSQLTPTANAFSYNPLLNTWLKLDCVEFFPVHNAAAVSLSGSLSMVTGGWIGDTQTVWISRIIDCPKLGEKVTLQTSILPPEAKEDKCAVKPAGGEYPKGTELNMKGTPTIGWVWSKWTVDLEGSQNPQKLVMDSDKSVTGNFKPTLTLSFSSTETENLAPPKKDKEITLGTAVLTAGGVDWDLSGLEFEMIEKIKSQNIQAFIKYNEIEKQGYFVLDGDGYITHVEFATPYILKENTPLSLRIYFKFTTPENEKGLISPLEEVKKLGVSIKAQKVAAIPVINIAGVKLPPEKFESNIKTVGSIWNISLTPNIAFATIQEAINDSRTMDGHTIKVLEGYYKYDETVTISKSLIIKGDEQTNNVIIDVPQKTAFNIGKSNTTIDNFVFDNKSKRAIYAENMNGITIKNSVFKIPFNEAVQLKKVGNLVINNNTFESGFFTAIEINDVNVCNIEANKFTTERSDQILIYINKVTGECNIKNNVDANKKGFVHCQNCSTLVTIQENQMRNMNIVYSKNINFTKNKVASITLWDSDNNIIFNNTIENSETHGIELISSKNGCNSNSIIKNKIKMSKANGIYCHRHQYSVEPNRSNIIRANNISFCRLDGILLHYVSKIELRGNEIYNNSKNGIEFSNSINNKIIANRMFNNLGNGLFITGKKNYTIKQNSSWGNGKDGIKVRSVEDCDIERNNIYQNGINGVLLEKCTNSSIIVNDIKGHTKKDNPPGCGIYYKECTGLQIGGNTLTKNCKGIRGSIYDEEEDSFIINNKITESTCSETGVHLEGGVSALIGNDITKNNGAAIALYNNAIAHITGNNIYDNPDLAVLNESSTVNINVDDNYWGGTTAPEEGFFSGSINYTSWLESPISLVFSKSSDTLISASGKTDSMNIYMQNFARSNDQVAVTLSDEQGWLLTEETIQLDLVDSTFSSITVRFQVPTDAGSNFNNKVTINAVSLTDGSMAAADSFYILNYTPTLAFMNIFPDSITIGVGDSLQIRASAFDQFEKEFVGDYQLNWSVSSGTIDSTGFFIAPDIESIVTISAHDSINGISNQAYLSVLQNPNIPQRILISPDSISVQPNSSVQFFARGLENNGFNVEFEQVWSSTAGEIDSTGMLLTGTTPGNFTVTVTDTAGSVSGNAIVVIEGIASVDDNYEQVPLTYSLKSNYPNPFNPTTSIVYEVPQSSRIHLAIYNIAGQKVLDLVNGEVLNAGTFTKVWDAASYSSGVYFMVLEAQSVSGDKQYQSVKKMMLLK